MFVRCNGVPDVFLRTYALDLLCKNKSKKSINIKKQNFTHMRLYVFQSDVKTYKFVLREFHGSTSLLINFSDFSSTQLTAFDVILNVRYAIFLPLSVTYIKCHNQHSPIHIHSLDRIFWQVAATNTEDLLQLVLLLGRLNEGRPDGPIM